MARDICWLGHPVRVWCAAVAFGCVVGALGGYGVVAWRTSGRPGAVTGPATAPAALALAQAAAQNGRFEEAVHLYGDSIERDDTQTARRGRAAAALQVAALLPVAKQDIDYLLAADGDDMVALRLRVDLHRAEGSTPSALADLNRLIEARQLARDPYLARGTLRSETGDYNGAVGDLSASIRLQPNNAAAMAERGRVLLKQGAWAAAVADLGGAIAAAPTADLYALRASALRELKNYPGEAADATAEVRLAPTRIDAWRRLAQSAYDSGRYQDAIVAASRGLDLAPDDVALLGWRGRAHMEIGALDAASGDFARAVEVNPGIVATYRYRGELELARGEWQAASDDLGRYLRSYTRDAEGNREKCWAELHLGHLAVAAKDCGVALKISPRDAAALRIRAALNLKLRKPRDAAADANAALGDNPGDAGALYLRGLARELLGQRGDAAADLAKAAKIDAKVAVPYLGLTQ